MKPACLLLLLLPALQLTAQKKLKVETGKSGDTTWSTKYEKIYVSPGGKNAVGEILKSAVYKSKNGFLLALSIQTGRTSIMTIDEGAAAIIELEDGNLITLTSINMQESRRAASDYGCFISSFYRLSGPALRQLRINPIKSIVINSSAGKLIYKLKEKQADSISDQLGKFEPVN
ncbi:MAG: hypothetical protein ABWZ25_18885 [Chitinophagaceae bacterium]